MITTIHNTILRERLSTNYTRKIQQIKEDLFSMVMSAVEIKKEEYTTQFTNELSQFWNQQHNLSKDERLTSTMLSLVDELQKNIIKSTKRIYAVKTDFFLTTRTVHVMRRPLF